MRPMPTFCAAVILIVGVGCLVDSVELTIAVRQVDDGWLDVSNANEAAWKDARLTVEAFESEATITPCGEEHIERWEPGETVRVPACAEKVRFTLDTRGETARFTYFNGQLYRRLGRREVPISQ